MPCTFMPSIKINMVDRQSHNWLIHHIYYRQSWLITVICCMKWSRLLWEETAGVLRYANARSTKQNVQSQEIFSWSFPGLMICEVVKELMTEKEKTRYGWVFLFFFTAAEEVMFSSWQNGRLVGWKVGLDVWERVWLFFISCSVTFCVPIPPSG